MIGLTISAVVVFAGFWLAKIYGRCTSTWAKAACMIGSLSALAVGALVLLEQIFAFMVTDYGACGARCAEIFARLVQEACGPGCYHK